MITDLFKKSGIYFIALSAGKLLNVFLFVLLARILGPSEFGDYLFFTSLVQLVTVLADFGLVQWFQKEAHEKKIQDLLREILPTRTLTLGISLVITSVFIIVTKNISLSIYILFLLIMIPEAYLSVFDGYYFFHGKSFLVALKTTIETALLIIGVLFFANRLNVHIVIYLYFATTLVSICWYIPWRSLMNISLISIRRQVQILFSSAKYAYLIFTSFAYARGDSFIIRLSLNSQALGLYGAAYRYLESLSLLPTALSHNLFPLSAKKGNITSRHLRHMILTMGLLGVCIGLVLFFGANAFIIYLVGPSYTAAVPVLKILAPVLTLFFINAPLSTIVQSSNFVKSFLPWGIGNTALNLLLNLLFIPIFGIVAAAWVMLFTEIMGLLINIYFVTKVYEKQT